MPTFPSDWPPGCPPNDAIDASGTVYRVVKADPCGAEDFRSHGEQGTRATSPECLRCGLSVFSDLTGAGHARAKYPALGNLIARGELHAQHGKIKASGAQSSTHLTWWPYLMVARHELFSVVDEA